ncbi:MAG: FtsX-like permease family protein [Bacteroidales bacterium]|nr:FtsX-like permease family protein [Bacteroidales bacterium]
MIRFIIKGLLRDKHRSILPIIIVSIGVMLTVLMHCYITGVMGDTLELTARFSTGHVKVMSRVYAENSDLAPNDLALIDVKELRENIEAQYPDMTWVERIKFGGLVDAPDEFGETYAQGPAMGIAIDIFNEGSGEIDRMNLRESIVRGAIPESPGEVLLSEDFSQNLGVNPGDEVTLISATMYGGMSISNFKVSGTVIFGIPAMDRGAMIADIEDIRLALDMNDATGELLGYFGGGYYEDENAVALSTEFNEKYSSNEDEFSPMMVSMRDQNTFATMIDMADSLAGIIAFVFILIMSTVLWNTGLIGGLRRYGEVGLRLAIGEEKGHIYRSMISESVLIGIVGSVSGTIFGLFFAYLLQTKGIDISGMMEGSTMMMPGIIRARITPEAYYLGFIPGLFSIVLGTLLSGIGIYKRQTAQLFKELDAWGG